MLMRDMRDQNLQYFTHNASDDINWMLNIRGWDIEHNQIAVCYLLITPKVMCVYLEDITTPDAVVQCT